MDCKILMDSIAISDTIICVYHFNVAGGGSGAHFNNLTHRFDLHVFKCNNSNLNYFMCHLSVCTVSTIASEQQTFYFPRVCFKKKQGKRVGYLPLNVKEKWCLSKFFKDFVTFHQ